MIKKHARRLSSLGLSSLGLSSSGLSLSAKLHREYLKVRFLPFRNALRSSTAIAKLRAPTHRGNVGKTRGLKNAVWVKPHGEGHDAYATGSVKIFHIIPLDDVD